MLVEKATVNSNKVPHGPRPTRIPRRSTETASARKARSAMPVAGPDRAVPEVASVESALPPPAREDTKLPVTAPVVNTGPGVRLNANARRPLARRTACPRDAANATATRMTPTLYRIVEAVAMTTTSGDGGATRRWTRRATRRTQHGFQRE